MYERAPPGLRMHLAPREACATLRPFIVRYRAVEI